MKSFWVVTGTTTVGKHSKDIRIAAQSSATVIILMGMKKLSMIVQTYQQIKNGHYIVALIQNGTFQDEKMICGDIDSMEGLVKGQKMSSLAFIIIGSIIDETIRCIEENKKVLITSYFYAEGKISNKFGRRF